MAKEKVTLSLKNIENPWVKESIRSLRNKLLMDDDSNKVFCVSSILPKEGVSTIVQLLALYLGDIKKKVIVVSADLKHENSEILTDGLTLKDYLRNSCNLDSIVQDVSEYFRIIVGSNSNEDYSDLLYLDIFEDMIDQLKSEYDIVLIDAPSFSTASEAILLSRLADSLILVVKENSVNIEDFTDFYKKTKKQNIKIKGIVLNRVSETENLEIALI